MICARNSLARVVLKRAMTSSPLAVLAAIVAWLACGLVAVVLLLLATGAFERNRRRTRARRRRSAGSRPGWDRPAPGARPPLEK